MNKERQFYSNETLKFRLKMQNNRDVYSVERVPKITSILIYIPCNIWSDILSVNPFLFWYSDNILLHLFHFFSTKSEIWIISHYLGLDNETTVSVVSLVCMFLLRTLLLTLINFKPNKDRDLDSL